MRTIQGLNECTIGRLDAVVNRAHAAPTAETSASPEASRHKPSAKLRYAMHATLVATSVLLGVGDRSFAATANEPEAASGGLQEIVVTAQRRAQSVEDVGVSVVAIGDDELRALNMVNSRDLIKAVPGLMMESTGGGGVNANLTVRGVSQGDYSSNQESPNAIYVDEVYVSSPNAAAFTLYDLSRVEVLRGPQGTLFGRASSGGLASFITQGPTRDWGGYVDAGLSSFNDVYVEAAGGGPITESVRFRVATRYEKADGWFENGAPGGSAAFAKNFHGVRAQVEADLTDRLTAKLSVTYDVNQKHNEGAYRMMPTALEPDQNGIPVPTYLPPGSPNSFTGYTPPTYSNWNKGDFNNVGFLQNHQFSPTLYLTYDLGGPKLTSITNFTHFNFKYNEDCDSTPIDVCQFGYGQNLDQYSEEVRVNGRSGNLTYTTGAIYLKVDQNDPQFFGYPFFSGTEYGFSDSNLVTQNMHSWGAFGQLEYDFTPKLRGIVGARYTQETKTFSSQTYFNELGTAYGGSGINNPPLLAYDFSSSTVGDAARTSQGLWSGKTELDFKPADHTLLYVSASRGVKAGGFNTNLTAALSNEQTPYKSEFVNAYEVGSKVEAYDRRLRVNASAFYYDYHRFQGYAFQGLQSVVGNYQGNFAGGELEIVAAPTSSTEISLSGSHVQTRIYGVTSLIYGPDRTEQAMMAPQWTYYASATKRVELPVGTLSFNWNGNYISSHYTSLDNNPGTYIDGSFEHNARVTLDLKSQKVEIALFINNIGNTARVSFNQDATASSGWILRSYDKPRWYGISLRKMF